MNTQSIKTFIILIVTVTLIACKKNEVNQIAIGQNAIVLSENSAVHTRGIGEEEDADPIIQLNGRIIKSDSTVVVNQVIDLVTTQDSSVVETSTSNQHGDFYMNVFAGDYRFALNIGQNDRIYTNIIQLQDSIENVIIVID